MKKTVLVVVSLFALVLGGCAPPRFQSLLRRMNLLE